MANDLPIEMPSRIQSSAMAIAVLVSNLMEEKLTWGSAKDKKD